LGLVAMHVLCRGRNAGDPRCAHAVSDPVFVR
jgi:hypothetical protein